MTSAAATIEFELREYLSEVMGIGEIGSNDDLFGVGGLTSLQTVDVLAFVEERFAIRIPPERVTRAGLSTIRQLVDITIELGGHI